MQKYYLPEQLNLPTENLYILRTPNFVRREKFYLLTPPVPRSYTIIVSQNTSFCQEEETFFLINFQVSLEHLILAVVTIFLRPI